MIWLEMTLATSLRYARTETGAPPPGDASGDPHRMAHDISDPLSLVRPSSSRSASTGRSSPGSPSSAWIVLYLV